jgi:hypothetical protein
MEISCFLSCYCSNCFCGSVAAFKSPLFVTTTTSNDSKDDAIIKRVFTNATQHAIFVDVFLNKAWEPDGNTTFDYAIVSDSSGKPLWSANIDVSVHEGQSATIMVPCDLTSGNYTVTLKTTPASSNFFSPVFTIS